MVTPCVGVWIETLINKNRYGYQEVTPCVGVWIETVIEDCKRQREAKSHPAWVCGLKP